MKLTPQQMERYSRHILLKEMGGKGQAKLLESKILVIGAGGLGSPLLLYLAAAGVGTIGIIDHDAVDLTNLQRQVIHTTADIGKLKAESARETIAAINPDVKVITYPYQIDAKNVRDIVKHYDMVADGSDNFSTRYIVNDACVLEKKPNVHGSVLAFEGQATVFSLDGGPCYRCLYPAPPPAGFSPRCREAGVLGIVPGVLGLIQATEAIKLMLGLGDVLKGRLLVFDALSMEFNTLKIRRRDDCRVCGKNPTITEPEGVEEVCSLQQAACTE